MKTKRFRVSEAIEDSSVRVDKEQWIIYDALLLGTKAKNKRRYTAEAREDAVKRGIYDGLPLYIGPHKKSMFAKRSPNNHAGELFSPRNTADGVRVNIRCNRATRGGQLMMEIAERFPKSFGLSHHALVDGYEENGEKLITRIIEAAVADVVKDPGTTSGIFEDTTVAEATEDLDTTDATSTPATADTDDGGESWESCLKELISEIHMDDDLDDDVKLKATKALMKLKQLLGGEGDGDTDTEDDEEDDAEEAVDVKALQARLAKLEKERVAPRKRKPVSSAARSEATEEVTPKPKDKTQPVLKKREDILAAYEEE